MSVQASTHGERPHQFMLTEHPEAREVWTYVIGPFDSEAAAEAHAKKFRIKQYLVKHLVVP